MEFSMKTLWPSNDVSETRGYLHHELEVDHYNTRYIIQNHNTPLKACILNENIDSEKMVQVFCYSTLLEAPL